MSLLDNKKIIKIKNRSNGTSGYTIPDLGNLHRSFMINETKEITMEELRKLSYCPGGMTILRDCFIIEDQEALAEILGEVEIEYNYTDAQILKLLNEGTLDELLDCLDFAPRGVLELIKKIAVDTELNDMRKREAIKDKLKFDISGAILINRESKQVENEDPTQKQRRVTPPANQTEETPAGRRVPQYNVINK